VAVKMASASIAGILVAFRRLHPPFYHPAILPFRHFRTSILWPTSYI